jgi:processing peptidase subunit beta
MLILYGCHVGAHCSSLMAQRVAINNLADSYMAFNTNYHDTGLFGFYATADPHHQAVDDLVRAMLSC